MKYVNIKCYHDYEDIAVKLKEIDINGYDITVGLNNNNGMILDANVQFTIDNVDVTLRISPNRNEDDVDVCWIDQWVQSTNFVEYTKREASYCRRKWPSAYIIIESDISDKYFPKYIQHTELRGYKMMNRKMGDKLAREMGAVKYMELSSKNQQTYKKYFDEIAFTYLTKLKDEKEERERAEDAKSQQQKEKIEGRCQTKIDCNIFYLLTLIMLIFAIFFKILLS